MSLPSSPIVDTEASVEQQHIPNKEREPHAPTRTEVWHCQFSSWYPTFSSLPPSTDNSNETSISTNPDHKVKNRSNVTIKSVILNELPPDFSDYLLADGLRLPAGTRTSGMMDLPLANADPAGDSSDEWSCNSDDEEELAKEDLSQEEETVFDFDSRVEEAIAALGGTVIPKLNWSAPKDAVWINGNGAGSDGGLACKTPGDVYLLLKASDFCLHDIRHAWEEATEDDTLTEKPSLCLVLRKWCNLYPSQEFRCFVKSKQLVAASQRDATQHWPQLLHRTEDIAEILETFFTDIVQSNFHLEDYVFDVYIDRRERVWLLDFNVWADRTDALLFSWDELDAMEPSTPTDPNETRENVEMRVVTTSRQVRADPLASYRAPIDTVHVAAMTSADTTKFREFMDLCQRPSEWEEESNDGD